MLTGGGFTVVDIDLTLGALEACVRAVASVLVDAVGAHTPIHARVRLGMGGDGMQY